MNFEKKKQLELTALDERPSYCGQTREVSDSKELSADADKQPGEQKRLKIYLPSDHQTVISGRCFTDLTVSDTVF